MARYSNIIFLVWIFFSLSVHAMEQQADIKNLITQYVQEQCLSLDKASYCVVFYNSSTEKVVSHCVKAIGTISNWDTYFKVDHNDRVTNGVSVPSYCETFLKYPFCKNRNDVVAAKQSNLQFFVAWNDSVDKDIKLNIIDYEENIYQNCVYKYKVYVPFEQLYKEKGKGNNRKTKKYKPEKIIKTITMPSVNFSGPITAELSFFDFLAYVIFASLFLYKIILENNKTISDLAKKKVI